MPPWSSRVTSPSIRTDAHPTPPNVQSSFANGSVPIDSPSSRPSDSEILEHAYGIPSLQPHPQSKHGASATSRSSRHAAGHSRSVSHPFPSIFNGKHHSKSKKRDGERGSGKVGGAGIDSTTDDELFSPVKSSSMGGGKSKGKVADKDLRTGNCMTCDSMVRWPKELKVFRCSVCLTINDLTPVRLEARREDGQRTQPVAGAGGHGTKVPPISVERTRQLIDRCITGYLLSRLRHDDTNPSYEDRLINRSTARAYTTTRGLDVSPSRSTSQHLSPPLTHSTHDLRSQYSSGTADMAQQRRRPSFNDLSSSSVAHTLTSLGAHRGPTNHDQTQGNLGILGSSRRSEEHRRGSSEMASNDVSKHIFKPLEDYIITCFGSYESVNSSFSSVRPRFTARAASEGSSTCVLPTSPLTSRPHKEEAHLSEMDAKTLLLGNFAENGLWWTGERSDVPDGLEGSRRPKDESSRDVGDVVTVKSPRIDWSDLGEWYYTVVNTSRGWRRRLDELSSQTGSSAQTPLSDRQLEDIEDHLLDAQVRIQRVLLKATETLLKRPSRPLAEPGDLRFLLLLLANPLLYPSNSSSKHGDNDRSRSATRGKDVTLPLRGTRATHVSATSRQPDAVADKGSSGQHSGIIKRILGLLSNVSNECHHHIVSWFARYSDSQFQRLADLIGSFITYRLTRQHGKKRDIEHDPTADLIPSMGNRRGDNTSAALHAALGSAQSQASRKAEKKEQPVIYNNDWQIKAAARVMSLVFSANNSGIIRRGDSRPIRADEAHSAGLAARDRAHKNGQILATSDFYNTLLDYSDLIADFEAWETKKSKFSFCQYPFFLSIWAKIKIMEHDARRQMEVKAREAFFDSIMTRKTVNQYLVLKIRRDCLVEDSLKGVSQVVGNGGEEIKKGLRIEFKGEEGIDAGGLRKEWFLLLVRDVFNPDHGMFSYDEDSHFCYFNPNSFETTDQFFLVGVVLGLAIYNSTILDVALPPFAFRKLLASAPAASVGSSSHTKTTITYTLDDLAEYRPTLAMGLKQLLEFEGDVESVYCRDFVADVERYGESIQIPLCTGGESRAVTNANRREFVDLYVRYLLDTSVIRQFEPFKRGFFTVCGGNALSLFRAEEIELLIRGSEEPLDIASLQAVSKNENWGVPNPSETEPVIQWFWDSFQNADPQDQRKLLGFITGSDRIPAMGATNLIIKLSCLGDDSPRFPIARTCFNQLSIWKYSSRAKFESKLWMAVHESEGFGLK